MPQGSPSPGSSKRFSDRENIQDWYHSRHDARGSSSRGHGQTANHATVTMLWQQTQNRLRTGETTRLPRTTTATVTRSIVREPDVTTTATVSAAQGIRATLGPASAPPADDKAERNFAPSGPDSEHGQEFERNEHTA
ncbi:hypothetical protein V8E53_014592 [Lactarius tabidus]